MFDNFLKPETLSLMIQTFNIAQRHNIFDSLDISDDDKNFILIDKGAFGHLGVTYTVIKENMVFTVEPGIYLDNKFGIRIEEMVVIKNGKAEIL